MCQCCSLIECCSQTWEMCKYRVCILSATEPWSCFFCVSVCLINMFFVSEEDFQRRTPTPTVYHHPSTLHSFPSHASSWVVLMCTAVQNKHQGGINIREDAAFSSGFLHSLYNAFKGCMKRRVKWETGLEASAFLFSLRVYRSSA